MDKRAELVTRAMRLHNELKKIRQAAVGLSYSDIKRWRLSIRAEKIGKQLKLIHEANEQKGTP